MGSFFGTSKQQSDISDELYEKMYYEFKTNGATYSSLAQKYVPELNLSSEMLRKRLARYNDRTKRNNVYTREGDEIISDYNNNNNEHDDNQMYVPYPAHLDDTSKWEKRQSKFFEINPVARVMIMTDMHLPDTDWSAVDTAINIAVKFQPHFILFTGDQFDLDAVSRWAKSRFRVSRDVFKEVASQWHMLHDKITKKLPKLIDRVAFRGNHEQRVDAWNALTGSPFADSTEEVFVNMIRSSNRVLWLGKKQETHVGEWFIQHGKRAGENAAKSALLTDLGGATPHAQGHNHRSQTFHKRINRADGSYKVITSVSVGALCNVPAHYIEDTDMSTWTQGCAVGHVFRDTGDVAIQNVVFNKTGDNVWASFGADIISNK